MDKFNEILSYMLNEKYVKPHDLIYKHNTNLNTNLTIYENSQFKQFKKELNILLII